MTRRGRAGAIVTAVTLVVAPAVAGGQDRYELFPFASMNQSLPGTPALLGAAFTTYQSSMGGVFGMRVGGAYDVRALAGRSETRETSRGWVGDVDAVISPARFPVIGPILGGFLPTFFTGVGMQGVRRDAGESNSTVVTSYGFGVARTFGGRMAFETEARRRVPVGWSGSRDASGDWQRGWEYRIGFKIGFGGSSTPVGTIPGIPFPAASGASRAPSRGSPSPAPTPRASSVLATADDYVGTRYQYGGASPTDGFDCSGYVQYVFRRHGITLPRTSRQQSTAGTLLPPHLSGVRAGDLLFFSQNGDRVDHVAIFAGNGRILHSSSSGDGVRYDALDSPRGRWFVERLVAARRVLGGGASFIDPGTTTAFDGRFDPPDTAPPPPR